LLAFYSLSSRVFSHHSFLDYATQMESLASVATTAGTIGGESPAAGMHTTCKPNLDLHQQHTYHKPTVNLGEGSGAHPTSFSSWKRDSNNIISQLVRLQHSADYAKNALRFLRLCVCAGNEGVVTSEAISAIFGTLASLNPPPTKIALMVAFLDSELEKQRKSHAAKDWNDHISEHSSRRRSLLGQLDRRRNSVSTAEDQTYEQPQAEAERIMVRKASSFGVPLFPGEAVQEGSARAGGSTDLLVIKREIQAQQTSNAVWFASVDFLRSMVRECKSLQQHAATLVSSGLVKAVRQVQEEHIDDASGCCCAAAALALYELACSRDHADHVNYHGVSSTIRVMRECTSIRVHTLAGMRTLRRIIDMECYSYPIHTVGITVLVRGISFIATGFVGKEELKARRTLERAILDEGAEILFKVVVSKDEEQTLLQTQCVEPMLEMVMRFIQEHSMFEEKGGGARKARARRGTVSEQAQIEGDKQPTNRKSSKLQRQQSQHYNSFDIAVPPKCLMYLVSLLTRLIVTPEGQDELNSNRGVSVTVIMMVRFYCLFKQEEGEGGGGNGEMKEVRKAIFQQLLLALEHVNVSPSITEQIIAEGRGKDIRSVLWAFPEQMNEEPLRTLVSVIQPQGAESRC
jgi:hypothetical protein